MPDNIRDENLRLRELMIRLVADGREIRAKLHEERLRSRELCDRAGRSLREPASEGPTGGPSETNSNNPE